MTDCNCTMNFLAVGKVLQEERNVLGLQEKQRGVPHSLTRSGGQETVRTALGHSLLLRNFGVPNLEEHSIVKGQLLSGR